MVTYTGCCHVDSVSMICFVSTLGKKSLIARLSDVDEIPRLDIVVIEETGVWRALIDDSVE